MFFSETFLALELTDYCNCACIMCSHSVRHVIHGNTKGFMDFKMLENLLQDLWSRNVKIAKLLPFGIGESLLHPQFEDILFLFKQYKDKGMIGQIDLHTNGQVLNKKLSQNIIKYKLLDTISFSLDTINPATYKKIRRFSGFNETLENVKNFLKLRTEAHTLLPKVILQLIVMDANKREVGDFIEYWSKFLKKLGLEYQVNFFWEPPMKKDTIFIKELNPFRESDIKEAKKLHRFWAKKYGQLEKGVPSGCNFSNKDLEVDFEQLGENFKVSGICSGPFKYISVAWDGTVTVCCIDTERELAIGNLSENSIVNLWNNDKINAIRKGLIKKDYSACPRCENCSGMDSPHLYVEELEKVKKELGLN